MKKKSLVETNPYLNDANMRKELVARSVRTSCGVEGIKKGAHASTYIDIPRRKVKKIYNTSK